MARVSWTRRAEFDLGRLYRFLARNDAGAAKRAVSTIVHSAQRLGNFPALGSPTDSSDIEIREWFVRFGGSGYLVLYRVEEDQVTVLAVRHGREMDYQ